MSLQHICTSLLLLANFGQFSSAESPSVIIIGAGAAGIAAASKLLQNSISNITILEAEDRIGGRIYSVNFGNTLVDLGAEFCYGTEGNVVYELVRDYNVLESKALTLNSSIYFSDGSKMKEELVEDFEEAIFGYLDEDGYENDGRTGLSVGEEFISRYNSTILIKYKNDPTELQVVKEGLRYAETVMSSIEGSYSWFDVSAKNDFVDLEGDWDQAFKNFGFRMVLDILMEKHPEMKNAIHLKEKVTKVNWKLDRSVTIQTARDNSYTADYVIFTPSLGVLKEQKDNLFEPKLPARKEEAIQALNFGSVAKLFAYFPTRWWHDEDTYFSFFWRDADLKDSDFPKGPKRNNASWVTQIVDFRKIQDSVWEASISGEMVPEVEKQPLDLLKDGLHYVLKKFLHKGYNVTEASDVLKTTWSINENFRGSFAGVKPGYYRKNLSYPKRLAEPLKNGRGRPMVLFAGDATHAYFTSTVHGAIESGFREAERIVQFHNGAK